MIFPMTHTCHSIIYLLAFMQDGEEVEFDLVEEGEGKRRAENVTGPDGASVQGSARRFDNQGGLGRSGYDGGGGGYSQGGGGYDDRY